MRGRARLVHFLVAPSRFWTLDLLLPRLHICGQVLAVRVRERDRIVNDTSLWLHDFQEGEVLVIGVLDALSFEGKLLADLLQVGGARVQPLDRPLQALKTQDEGCDVVEGSAGGGSPDDDLDAIGRCLVLVVLAHSSVLALLPRVRGGISSGSLLVIVSLAALVGSLAAAHFEREVDLFSYSVPDGVDAVSVVEALENAIAADHDEVEVVLDLEALDVGVADNHVRVAAEPRPLGLNVPEGLRDREAAWEDPQRTLHIEILLPRALGGFGKGLRSIYLSAGCLNSDLLELVVWLVVSGEHADLRASVDGHDGPGVAYVDDENRLIDNHDDGGAGAGPLGAHGLSCHQVLGPGLGLLDETEEVALALAEAFADGFDRVLRELLVLNHEVVEIVP